MFGVVAIILFGSHRTNISCTGMYEPYCKEYYLIYCPVESSIRNALEFSCFVRCGFFFSLLAVCVCVCAGCVLAWFYGPPRSTIYNFFCANKIHFCSGHKRTTNIFQFIRTMETNWVNCGLNWLRAWHTVPFSVDLFSQFVRSGAVYFEQPFRMRSVRIERPMKKSR